MHRQTTDEQNFILTNHALERMTYRGVREKAVQAVLDFGRVISIRGADHCVIGRKEVAYYAKEGIDLSPYEGLHVVVGDGGVILTVYRNHSLRGLRRRGVSRRWYASHTS